MSEEQKRRLSESMKGEKNPNYGKHRSDETRSKISESMKGQKNHFFGITHTESNKKIISDKNKCKTAWNKGIHWSYESRKKMSIAHIGIYPSKETIMKSESRCDKC